MRNILLYLGYSAALLAAEPTIHISGTVIHGISKQKLAGARVYLTSANSSLKPLSMVTKADGRFEFNVPAGKYRLEAETAEIYRQVFGGRTAPAEFGVSLIAQPGAPTEDLSLPIFPPGGISGKVTDPHGDAVENGLVQLF
jgi:hypothetical protein